MRPLLILLLIVCSGTLSGQTDSLKHKKVAFTGDFRFRVEHDWNSQNQNGVQRDDRSRLRYRFRFGLNYSIDKHSSFGGRLRSGNINDQQGPHVTLGGNKGEFELVTIGFEKLYYQYKNKYITSWIGKNSMPLKKLNEIFWNDNVFPEGLALTSNLNFIKNNLFKNSSIAIGHFIIKSNNKTFTEDSYLQVFQLRTKFFQERIILFPGFYYFNKVGNFPDGKQTFALDYAIFHGGSQFVLHKKRAIKLGVELYHNATDYAETDSVATDFKNQNTGVVLSATYGNVKKKGDWLFSLTYADIQKYAIVDYFAQNDWSRWDYSAVGATGARISNFRGAEILVGYAIKEKFNLIFRAYFVEQLVKTGNFLEDGNRARLDLNIGF